MKFRNIMLQLFADMNTNVTSQDAMSPTMKEYYDTELLENARGNLVFNQFGEEVPLPKGRGKKVSFRRFKTFKKATKPLVEGVTPAGGKLQMEEIEQTIEQYGDYVAISDRLELEAVDPIILGATEESGAQANETLDTVTRNEVISGMHVMYAGGKNRRHLLGAEDTITTSLINKANTHLKKMKAPKTKGKYVAIIHPSVAEDLRETEGWVEAHKYADPEKLFNGEIGELHGIRFVETTEQKIYRGDDLAEDSRTLLVNGQVSSGKKVKFDGGKVEADALIGRYVLIGDEKYLVVANTTTELTLADALTEQDANVVASDNAVIYPGEGGKEGCAVYATLVMSEKAYGRIKPTAESLQMIIKQKGSAGSADPLDQRSTVGWKASHAAKILYQERLLRIESGSSYSEVDEGN